MARPACQFCWVGGRAAASGQVITDFDHVAAALPRPSPGSSPAGLAACTGATLGSTAYHVRALLAAEVIERASEKRGVRGSVEHFYKLVRACARGRSRAIPPSRA